MLLQNSSGKEVTETTRRTIHVVDEYEAIGDYCELITKYAIRKDKECEVMAGLHYTDILTVFNSIRTHALNIVEATAGLP